MIAAFARLADGGAKATRKIEGQKTMLGRTMHGIAYDAIHDEIVVPQQFGQAILTFRGGANGEEPPIRVIQGSRTQLRSPDRLAIDPVHNEIFVIERGFMLVFPREGNGNVAPIRRLEGLETGITSGSRVTVDPIRDLLIVSASPREADSRLGELRIFNRTDDGNVKPKRIITGGPKSGTMGPSSALTVYPPTGMIVATTSAYRDSSGDRSSRRRGMGASGTFVGAWNIEDSGDVPPRWTIVHNIFRSARGITLDPKHKTLIVSDKGLNSVMTFYFPEIF